MEVFTNKIVKETNGIKMLLKGAIEAIMLYIILILLVRPNIIETLNKFYEVCARDGVSWYKVWIMLLPFIIVIGLLCGLLEFLILYSKNINKKLSKKN